MGTVTLEDRVMPAEDALSRNLDGETVIVDLHSGLYYSLDDTGTRIWELLAVHPRLADVATALVEEFEVDRQTVEADLLRLVGELLEEGLVRRQTGPSAEA